MNWLQRNLLAAHKSNWGSDDPSNEHYHYDGVRAFRDALFPLPKEGVLREPSGDEEWKKVVDTYPFLFARCFRDEDTVRRLATEKGEHAILYAVQKLLDTVATQYTSTDRARLRPQSLMPSPPTRAARSELATLWRCISPLLRVWHQQRARVRRAAREGVLSSFLDAITATAAHGDAVADRQMVNAIRHSAESLCSSLLHNEALVRGIGLDYFAGVARCLRDDLRTTLPNAVVHCLLLSMGQPTALTAGDDALHRYLAAPAKQRWLPALSLVEQGHGERAFRVTGSHLRALLSGLQSISIPETWRQALQCTEVFEQRYAVLPDAAGALKLILNLEQQSWQRAFDVLRYFKGGDKASERKRSGKAVLDELVPTRVLRDLQLLTVKHAAWQTTLQLMDSLRAADRHAKTEKKVVGFMNVLYCVYAAATAGNVDLAVHYFVALSTVPGVKGTSPFNEITVATAMVAMLDRGHYDGVVRLAARLLAELTKGDGHRPSLTRDGYSMCIAALLLGALLSGDYARVTRTFERLLRQQADGGAPADAVLKDIRRNVLDRSLVLFAMTGMTHLNAPIRLIFDVLGSESVYSYYEEGDDFEGRQRLTNKHRRPLYIPPQHCHANNATLAKAFGLYQKQLESEKDTTATISTLLAETMTTGGVGMEYLQTIMC
ncbi:hypothetical protein STCU_07642 [Strigomonas culicis]|uniref:Uncharacterized protein n=1 Tax=Strigomonas culicis TaxID=28005 RepID=S9U3U3_9TRYP|nr:hypothetical protein STCU_07642 [Strigomonas culicis]|eukprot:EPY23583.1 hypothetical protein STCU_07642 [Strigomonas culicis]